YRFTVRARQRDGLPGGDHRLPDGGRYRLEGRWGQGAAQGDSQVISARRHLYVRTLKRRARARRQRGHRWFDGPLVDKLPRLAAHESIKGRHELAEGGRVGHAPPDCDELISTL